MRKKALIKISVLKSLICAALVLNVSALQAAEYSVNLKNTEITEFTNLVGKNLSKTIIVDSSVRGRINVRSYDLLNEEQYYQFFLQVLEAYGYSVIELENNILKVVRSKDARTEPIPITDRSGEYVGAELVTRVVPVKNVSVNQLSPLLRQLVNQAQGGHVVHYDPSNVLMITGSAAIVDRLVEIVKRVDKAGDQEVNIVKLKHADATQMVQLVSQLLTEESRRTGGANILVPKLAADSRSNSIIISGDPQARSRIIELVRQLDTELENNGNTKVFYLKYADAKNLVAVLKGVAQSLDIKNTAGKPAAGANAGDTVSIEADENTNALVITASADKMTQIEKIISDLDIRKAQVLVQAIIAEISESNGVNFGVQWGNANGAGIQYIDSSAPVSIGEVAASAYAFNNSGGTQTNYNSEGEVINIEESPKDASLIASALGKVNGMALGFYSGDWGALLTAVATDTKSNLLASPTLVTLDNKQASFIVGEEVPTITGSTAGDNNANPFQTVERKEVGVKLDVKPQINEGDSVQLEIQQEVSNVSGNTAVDVTFAKREIQTTVLVKSGETVVLGGLLNKQSSESISKVPVLGDLPLVGTLFRYSNSSVAKRNLMVFIKPTILRDSNAYSAISARKYALFRASQLQRAEAGIALMPNAEVPLFPEYGLPIEYNTPEVIEAIENYKDLIHDIYSRERESEEYRNERRNTNYNSQNDGYYDYDPYSSKAPAAKERSIFEKQPAAPKKEPIKAERSASIQPVTRSVNKPVIKQQPVITEQPVTHYQPQNAYQYNSNANNVVLPDVAPSDDYEIEYDFDFSGYDR